MAKNSVRTGEPETIDVQAREVQGVDPTRVESLTDLIGEAERMEAPPAGEQASAGPAASPTPPVDPENAPGVADIVNLLQFAREASDPMLVGLGLFQPGQVGAIWSDAALKGVAVPLVQVCDRHGVGLGDLADKFGPYVGLFLGIAMPTMATVKVLRENQQARGAADGGQ